MTDQIKKQNTDSVSLIDIIDTLLGHFRLIVTTVTSIAVLTVIILFLITPTYQASLIMVNNENNSSGGSGGAGLDALSGLAGLAGITLPSGQAANKTETIIATLQSRIFLEQFIDKNNLMPKLYEEYWDSETQSWDTDSPPSLWGGVNQISNMITVDFNKRTPVIRVNLENENPIYAAEWLNKLIKQLDDHLRKKAIAQTESSLEFLEMEVGNTNLVTQQNVLYKLILDQKTNNMMANVSKEYAISVIDPAVVPRNKFTPKKLIGLIIGIIVGFVLSIILILYKEFKDKFAEKISI